MSLTEALQHTELQSWQYILNKKQEYKYELYLLEVKMQYLST